MGLLYHGALPWLGWDDWDAPSVRLPLKNQQACPWVRQPGGSLEWIPLHVLQSTRAASGS